MIMHYDVVSAPINVNVTWQECDDHSFEFSIYVVATLVHTMYNIWYACHHVIYWKLLLLLVHMQVQY